MPESWSTADDWDWLAAIDPRRIESERFNVDAKTVKYTEGTQLGLVYQPPTPAERIRIRQERLADAEIARREQLHQQMRDLEKNLARERREHKASQRWGQRLYEVGYQRGAEDRTTA